MSAFFGILGPLKVEIDGRVVAVPAAKHRLLLAVLVLRANQVVGTGELIDRLWGAAPPAGARNTLRAYVMRLRRLLAAPQLLRTMPAGYSLELPSDSVDLYRFRGLVARARESGDSAEAWQLLTDALGLWRGELFADVPTMRRAVASMDEELLRAKELRFEAGLVLGRSGELSQELDELAKAHPHREPLWAQLIRALHGCGRQHDALAAYRAVSRRLAEDLGIDPGADLQQLHSDLLAVTVPSQLPAHVLDFVGRDDLVRRIEAELTARTVVLTGPPGVGKTALAIHVAHRLRSRFPDGQLFVDLRGYSAGAALNAGQVLSRFLRALGVRAEEMPAEVEARSALFGSLVAGSRMLVVLDNAADPAQVRPLLPNRAGCSVLVTSRDRLDGLLSARQAVPVRVDGFTPNESRVLLERMSGYDAGTAEIGELAELCAHLPLALRIAAANLVTSAYPDLPRYLGNLRDGNRLSALAIDGDEQVVVRAVFELSCQALQPDTQHMFGLLGLVPGPDFTAEAAAAVIGTIAVDGLRQLVSSNLLAESAAGRYRMHDLIRLYAAERAHQRITLADRHAALRRLVDFCIHTARAADLLLNPHRQPVQFEPPVAGVVRYEPADHTAAIAWFEAEHACLLATQQLAVQRGWHDAVWQLAWTLTSFHSRRGYVADELASWQAGLAAADQLGDPAARIVAYRHFGNAHRMVGRNAEAAEHLAQALTLAESTGAQLQQAHIHRLLSMAWEQRGDQQALRHAEAALSLFRLLGDQVWEAEQFNSVGWFLNRLGRNQQARASCEAALALNRRLGNRNGEANALDSLGVIAHQTGLYIQAVDHYRQAFGLFRDLGNTYEVAETLTKLGRTHLALGEQRQARTVWQQALAMYQAQRRPEDVELVRQLLAALDE